jgi:hypothetical protein
MQLFLKFIKQIWEKSHAKWQQEQQQQMNVRIINLMCSMTADLYEAFNGKTYAHLIKISSVEDIRLHNYKRTTNGILYQFTIAKQNPDNKLASIHKESIRKNMNLDIASAQRTISYNYGYNYLANLFPFLYCGVYVLSVQDCGSPDVIITVTTHVQP